jgi:hypothetical protein
MNAAAAMIAATCRATRGAVVDESAEIGGLVRNADAFRGH